jgi:hypothetical protein
MKAVHGQFGGGCSIYAVYKAPGRLCWSILSTVTPNRDPWGASRSSANWPSCVLLVLSLCGTGMPGGGLRLRPRPCTNGQNRRSPPGTAQP